MLSLWWLVSGVALAEPAEAFTPRVGIGAGMGGWSRPWSPTALSMSAPSVSLRWLVGNRLILEPSASWVRVNGTDLWEEVVDPFAVEPETRETTNDWVYTYRSAGLSTKLLFPVNEQLLFFPFVEGAWESSEQVETTQDPDQDQAVLSEATLKQGWRVGGGLGGMLWLRANRLSLSAELSLVQYGVYSSSERDYEVGVDGDPTWTDARSYDLRGFSAEPSGRVSVHLYF